ncbi:MAG: DUF2339 domain-containing protein [Lentisphaerae bacterium]|nr:DUF2339 domain-containing protein [Lentisphaerota bacterium]
MTFLANLAAFAAIFLCWRFHFILATQKAELAMLQSEFRWLKESVKRNIIEDTPETKQPAKKVSNKDQVTKAQPVSKDAASKRSHKKQAASEVKSTPKIAALKTSDADSKVVKELPKTAEQASSKVEKQQAEPSDSTSAAANSYLRNKQPAWNSAHSKAKTSNQHWEKLSEKVLESFSNGQWAVWLGGIALAFGSIFLIKYSIEVGLLGPKARLAIAASFGLVMIGAGEFFRHRPFVIHIAKINKAYVPGILTAVGSLMLFAVTYIAYVVFGFIGPAFAFAVMGILSLSTLALALLHGPPLAALGLLGSYITPALVDSSEPNYAALYLFLFIVTCSSIALAWVKQWSWLAIASAVGALGWAGASVLMGENDLLYSGSFQIYLAALWIGYSCLGILWSDDTKNPSFLKRKLPLCFRISDIDSKLSNEFAVTFFGIFVALWAITLSYFHVTSFQSLTMFAVMGLLSVATFVFAVLHGERMAVLGLVGSYIVPALTLTSNFQSSDSYIYLFVVTSTALLTSWKRNWVWLIMGSAIGALGWSVLTIARLMPLDTTLFSAYLALLGIVYCLVGLVWKQAASEAVSGPQKNKSKSLETVVSTQTKDLRLSDVLPTIILLLGLISAVYVHLEAYKASAVTAVAVIIFAAWVTAWMRDNLSLQFTTGAVIGLVVLFGQIFRNVTAHLNVFSSRDWQLYFTSIWEPSTIAISLCLGFVTLVLCLGMLKILSGIDEKQFGNNVIHWALPVSLVPLASYGATWLALGMTRDSIGIFILGIAGTILLGLSTELILKQVRALTAHKMMEVFPLSLIGGTATLFAVLTIFFNFGGANLVVLSAFLATAIAALTIVRPVEVLRYGAIVAAVTAMGTVILNPTLDLVPSKTIFFNSILLAYGLPALAFWIASWLLSKTGRDLPQKFFEGAAVLFTALLFTLQIRHGMNGGDILSGEFKLEEQAGHTITALVMAGTLMRLNDRSPSVIFQYATLIFGYISLGMVLLSHGLILNPYFTNQSVGSGLIFNTLLVAYLVPGIIAGIVHWISRSRRPLHYVTALETVSWLLLSGFVFLTVRHLFHGEFIGRDFQDFTTEEIYTHTLSMLVIIAAVGFLYERLFNNWKSYILPFAFVVTIATFIFINLLKYLPLRYGVEVGEQTILNALLHGFLLPTILFLAIRQIAKSLKDWDVPYFSQSLGGLALVTGFAWATFTVRHIWHGSALYNLKLYSTETYTYSAMWLLLGVGILLLAEWKNSKEMKGASAIFIFAATIKVFLFDMSALEGGLRALSFIGLGVVLIGIGLFFQRLLFRDTNKTDEQKS